MYNSRRQEFQKQTLRPDEIDFDAEFDMPPFEEMSSSSIQTPSIQPSASIQPSIQTSVKATHATQFIGMEDVEIDLKTRSRIRKNVKFEPLSELALKYFREMLSARYFDTLSEMIETGNHTEHSLKNILQPVLATIDQKLRRLNFPGHIDPLIFNINLDTLLVSRRY
ncbi:hypothetical protein G6F56_009028 [Rhizopus delemar]|nr:hypothetical protein G6F56_009028 [Rhizopus delemar]